MKKICNAHEANFLTAACSAILLTIAGAVYGHSGATGVVKERMDAMTDMGDISKAIADMFKGKREFDRNSIVDAAERFIEHGTQMNELFPDTEESRTGSQTEALPRIWSDGDEFLNSVNEFVELSESLKATAESSEDPSVLRKAFFRTTKGCSACHKRFRKPKER